VLDTYWSDHCRHTTFSTELKNVSFTDGDYREPMEETYKQYLADREVIYKGRDDKYVCLMDLALMAMKKLRSEGKLQDMEVSDEINACSIVVPVEIDGATEEWLVNFKNETHNHPTEIEPFGGAATCLGGAIRCQGVPMCTRLCALPARPIPPGLLGRRLKASCPRERLLTAQPRDIPPTATRLVWQPVM
jgi:phosphoribosylformylglycinamidine synthase